MESSQTGRTVQEERGGLSELAVPGMNYADRHVAEFGHRQRGEGGEHVGYTFPEGLDLDTKRDPFTTGWKDDDEEGEDDADQEEE